MTSALALKLATHAAVLALGVAGGWKLRDAENLIGWQVDYGAWAEAIARPRTKAAVIEYIYNVASSSLVAA